VRHYTRCAGSLASRPTTRGPEASLRLPVPFICGQRSRGSRSKSGEFSYGMIGVGGDSWAAQTSACCGSHSLASAGSDLTANHIIQTALVIGGTRSSPGLVTIDASDANGNPLGQPNGFALSGSLTPGVPFEKPYMNFASLSTATTASEGLAVMAIGNSVGSDNHPGPVPVPPTLLLALLAVLGVISTQFVRHHFRCQTV
jgi:hypothetical protein